jgi:hypothetical protein
MNNKPGTKTKYNYADEITSCKIPLPSGISLGYENNISSYFGWGDDNNMNERVMFENRCSGAPESTETCAQKCNGSNEPCSDNAVGKKIISYKPIPNNNKVTYKNTVTVEDTKCRVENKTNWVKDSWGTICPLNDYVHTNYYQCLKKDGGVDDVDPGGDGKSRERCCRANLSNSSDKKYCGFISSPCKSYPWGRSIAYNSAKDDLGGVDKQYKGMVPKNTGESCTSDHECKFGCRATGKCG